MDNNGKDGKDGYTTAHDHPLIDAFPETLDFLPWRYALPAILRPDYEGRYRTDLNQRKVKILTAVKPALDRLMRPGEQVVHVAMGTAYDPVEKIFDSGMFSMLYSRYAVVATNRRLLIVNTNLLMTKTRHYLFQIAYANIKKVSRGLFRTSLAIVPKKGRRRMFISMNAAFTAELQTFIQSRLTPEEAPAKEAMATNLCPACYVGLPAGHDRCMACQAVFKTAGKATSRSLLLPGWGNFYLDHRLLGCVEFTGSLLVWAVVFGLLVRRGWNFVPLARRLDPRAHF